MADTPSTGYVSPIVAAIQQAEHALGGTAGNGGRDSRGGGTSDGRGGGAPASLAPRPTDGRSWKDAELGHLRDLFPLEPDLIHLNTGTIGSAPYPVLDLLDSYDRDYARVPRDPYPPTTFAEARQSIAGSLGCDYDELVIAHNTTHTMGQIFGGLDLHEGDEIITTDHECYSVQAHINMLHNRRGVVVKKLTPLLGHHWTAEDYVRQFEAAVTPRTRVLEFAAVTFTTGTAMPIRLLAEMAQRYGITTVMDAAHLPGLFDVRLRELGVDFIGASGSKWQCGPMGTGILYIRNKVLPQYNPLPLPRFWPIISIWYPIEGELPPREASREATYDIAEQLQKAGTASPSKALALQKACEIWDEIGRDRIERHALGLNRYFQERVIDHWGKSSMYCPTDDPRLLSAITAFNPFGPEDATNLEKHMRFVSTLEERHRVAMRWTFFPAPDSADLHYGARVCTHLYNSREEIDRLVDGMIDLCAEMA
jgi:enediyne biosynthesis protein CalE9